VAPQTPQVLAPFTHLPSSPASAISLTPLSGDAWSSPPSPVMGPGKGPQRTPPAGLPPLRIGSSHTGSRTHLLQSPRKDEL
jgi:hypothetical protein